MLATDADLAWLAAVLHLSRHLVGGGLGDFLVARVAEVFAPVLDRPATIVA
jgi:hypothetical protein